MQRTKITVVVNISRQSGARGLPPDPDNLNNLRAKWAHQAILAFANETGQDEIGDGLEEILGDLLINFGHFADQNNLNLSRLVRRASEAYLEETDGYGTQFIRAREDIQ